MESNRRGPPVPRSEHVPITGLMAYCCGMLDRIDRRSTIPVYLQLAELLEHGITDGRFPPGTTLPSVRALAATHGTGRDAVIAALAELHHAGMVQTRQGRPYEMGRSRQSGAASKRYRDSCEGRITDARRTGCPSTCGRQ